MFRCHKRVLLLFVLAGTISLYWGCSQPDDVVLGKSQTVLDLTAERLPTPPNGMMYKLWVCDAVIDDSVQGAVPIEAFSYDFESRTFLDSNGVARDQGSRFAFSEDIFNYGWLFVTVQRTDGSGPDVGPVMLIDTVMDPDDDVLELKFPYADSIWQVSVEFNMETPSDGRDASSDGAGIWFSVYNRRTATVQDTYELRDNWIIDTSYSDTFKEYGECITSITNIYNVDTARVERIFGFDTVEQTIVTYDVETITVCDSGQGNLLTTQISNLNFRTRGMSELPWDDFQQVALELKNVSSYGWKYEGWVVSSVIDELGVSEGDITPPAWIAFNTHDSLIRGFDGGLLRTGTFTSLFLPDEDNPYVESPYRVPPFPGEDFFQNLPGGQSVPVNLVPGDHITGTAFITLEPTNRLSDNTNFPLFVQIRDLPETRGEVEDSTQQFRMQNMTQSVTGDLKGFPRIQVDLRRL